MKLKYQLLFTLLFMSSVISESAHSLEQEQQRGVITNQDLQPRTVFFELEDIEGSSAYDVELVSYSQRWQKNHRFKIDTNTLRLRLTPGKYKVRTRTYNQNGYYGQWSGWQEFNVRLQLPEDYYPKEGDIISPIGKEKERITFEWVSNDGIVAYLFEVLNEKDELIEEKLINSYFTTTFLEVGKNYKWSITPLTYIGEEKDPELEKKYIPFEIKRPVENLTPIQIEIQEIPIAVRYEMEFQKKIGENKYAPPAVYESILPDFRARLEPGAYELRVRSVFRDGTKSDWGPPTPFFVPYTSAVARSPRDGLFRSSTLTPDRPEDANVEIEWEEVPGAPVYALFIYNDQGEVIQTHETTELSYTVQLDPEATYHYHIQAYSENESRRDPPKLGDRTYEFTLRPYTFINLGTTEEPSTFYGWTSYQTSRVSYESLSFDDNAEVINSLNGGSGEVALGYWHRFTNVGFLLTYNLSGIRLRDESYFYSTYGAQLGYRYLIDKKSRLRFWFGMARKSMPQLIARPGSNFLDVQNITTTGPYVQTSYMYDINDEYGIYGLLNYYQSAGQDSETPNGEPLNKMDSVNFSVFLSRVYKEKYRLRLGYSYKNERLFYPTISKFENDNSVRIDGHYISFNFEFAIGPTPYRQKDD